MLGHVMLCYVMLRDITLFYVKT